jgi:hypothetical protein
MKYRVAEIFPLTALDTTAGTKSIPLNLSDPISALLFEYKNTRGSTTMIEHPCACLPTISLVDGSDVIFSLSGKEMHALAHWDKAIPPYSLISNISGDMCLLGIPYNFGRKLWDPDLAFDPKKFKNPQLNISHSYRLMDASSSAHSLSIQALCFDEKTISPQGFLMSKTYATPAWVASGVWAADVLLPTDYLIRKLMLRGYLDDAYVYQVINHIKISEDNDKKVPYDHDVSTLMKLINSMYPRYQECLQASFTTGTLDVFCTPSFDIAVAGGFVGQTSGPAIEKYPLNEPFYITAGGSYNGAFQVSGHEPHATIIIPFGDQADLTDWYDVSKIGKLILKMKGGSAGSSSVVSVVTQQLRTY